MTMPEETLDPGDWDEFARIAHEMVDEALAWTRGVRDRPVWQQAPDEVMASFRTPVPRAGEGLEAVHVALNRTVMTYPMGNVHPRFWGWYMGASNLTGALGDFMAAVQGSNLGGFNHAAVYLDLQVVDWLRQLVGFPQGASGTLTSGGSMANMIGLTVARNTMAQTAAGIDLREEGLAALERPLRFYASDEVHSCHQKVIETLGLGNRALRRIPTGADCRLDLSALKSAIDEDRAAGWQPACVIATAGTVNSGAVDDLKGARAICDAEGMWLHVDGCVGALVAMAPRYRQLVEGIGAADSLALDPHKMMHAPFEAGCALVRDAERHLASFTLTPAYLERAPRGLADGPHLHDWGLQTSRGFRALKVWMSLKEQGADKLGRIIAQNLDLARGMGARVEAEPMLELVAPVVLDIVCFRYRPPGLDEAALKALNLEIMMRLQDEGLAVVTDTTLHGRHCLRAALANHRTRREDIEMVLDAVLRLGAAIMAEAGASAG